MRGRLSEQDLTDYALNELRPEERMYVESILAVSEESRHDVYEMIELGQMLEEGFETRASGETLEFSSEQRQQLIDAEVPRTFWQNARAGMAAAACLAAMFGGFSLLRSYPASGYVAGLSSKVSQMVANAVDSDSPTLSHLGFGVFASFAEDSSNWLPSAGDALDSMECTPPFMDGNGQ